MIGDIINTVSITTNVNSFSTSALYHISYYVPESKERLQRDFIYYNILTPYGEGIILKVRVGGYYREVDFKACSIINKSKIDTDNTKFFMKGVFRRDTNEFKDMKVGSDFVVSLTTSSPDSQLAKVISDFIKTLCVVY